MDDFDKMVQARLVNNTAPWPMHISDLADFYKAVEIMGLVETVPGEPSTHRNTPLGEAINLHLLMAFLGIFEASEVPWVLQDNGLIDEPEFEWMLSLLGDDGVDHAPLRPAVRRAYTRAMNKGVIRWRMN